MRGERWKESRMAIQWESVPREQHEALPKRTGITRDPEWDDIMNELQYTDNAVRLPYTDQKHRGTLSRSVGRRAAHRGFKTDIRHGQNERGGFISVRRLERMEE